MKIATMTLSLSRAGAGVFEIARALSVTMAARPDREIKAFGVADAFSGQDQPLWGAVPTAVGEPRQPRAIGYSPALGEALIGWQPDIVHVHGLWSYPSILARRWSRRTARPYVTTVHGYLEPWALANSGLKKKIALALYERSALRDAGCLHVNTTTELDHVRALGIPGPYCVVSNGVFLPDLTRSPPASPMRALKASGAKLLLFLGRLHPKKNLAASIDAFASVATDHPDWHFAIAGWDQIGYRETLETLVAERGIADRVHFLGPVFGPEKDAVSVAADAFILASHSEGQPMAIMEALASATPVLMTDMCNFQPGFDAGAAVRVGIDVASIAAGMRTLFQMPDPERRAMGERGRALVSGGYTWDRVADQLLEVYDWLAGGGPRPAHVLD